MTDAVLFPDEYLSVSGPIQPGTSASDARPGDEASWIAVIPDDGTAEKSSLTITLPSLSPVQKIYLSGTFKETNILLQGKDSTFVTKVQNTGQPIRLEDLEQFGEAAPTELTSITITPVSGLEGNTVTLDVKVWACVDLTCEYQQPYTLPVSLVVKLVKLPCIVPIRFHMCAY